MEKPPTGVPLVFVKLVDGVPWYTTFRLHFDNSCGFCYLTEGPEPRPGSMRLGPGCLMHVTFEFDPDGWRHAFNRLAELGFVPLAEAQRCGWLPAGWQVPANSPEWGTASQSCSS